MKPNKRRGRGRSLKRFKTILFILFIAVLIKGIIPTPPAEAEAKETIIEYHVTKGQTLWHIAKQFKKENEDIRQTIYNIEKLNNLDTATIYEGQTLKIKIEE